MEHSSETPPKRSLWSTVVSCRIDIFMFFYINPMLTIISYIYVF